MKWIRRIEQSCQSGSDLDDIALLFNFLAHACVSDERKKITLTLRGETRDLAIEEREKNYEKEHHCNSVPVCGGRAFQHAG
jgi:hypothetical protein